MSSYFSSNTQKDFNEIVQEIKQMKQYIDSFKNYRDYDPCEDFNEDKMYKIVPKKPKLFNTKKDLEIYRTCAESMKTEKLKMCTGYDIVGDNVQICYSFEEMCDKHRKLYKRKNDECCVCFEEVEDKDIPLNCTHRIHKQCLIPTNLHMCPVCKYKLNETEKRYFFGIDHIESNNYDDGNSIYHVIDRFDDSSDINVIEINNGDEHYHIVTRNGIEEIYPVTYEDDHPLYHEERFIEFMRQQEELFERNQQDEDDEDDEDHNNDIDYDDAYNYNFNNCDVENENEQDDEYDEEYNESNEDYICTCSQCVEYKEAEVRKEHKIFKNIDEDNIDKALNIAFKEIFDDNIDDDKINEMYHIDEIDIAIEESLLELNNDMFKNDYDVDDLDDDEDYSHDEDDDDEDNMEEFIIESFEYENDENMDDAEDDEETSDPFIENDVEETFYHNEYPELNALLLIDNEEINLSKPFVNEYYNSIYC